MIELGLWDIITDAIRNRQISKTNIYRRGLTQYKPSQIGGFVEPDINRGKVICSGDANDLRSEVIVSLCVAATNAGIPVIVLHQGDLLLKNMFQNVYNNHPAYIEVSSTRKRYDPFFQLSNSQISKIIVDTAPQKYALTCDGEAYIDVLTGYLSGKGRKITLKGLYDCPHNRLPILLNSAASKQQLSPVVIQGLQISLAQGQKESHKVKAYLEELYDECYQLLPINKGDYINCTSIFQAINQRAVLCLDIISERNILLLRIIAEQLQLLLRRQIPFFVILDNISIKDTNSMKSIVSTKSGGFGCAITGDDLLSLCDGDEKLFNTLLGDSKKWFVFHHSSGITAKKWSAAFSEYQKIDTTINYGRGYGNSSSYGFPISGGLLGGGFNWNKNKNNHQGVSYTNKDEAIIRGEEIQKLPIRGGFVYTAETREIAYVPVFLPQ